MNGYLTARRVRTNKENEFFKGKKDIERRDILNLLNE